MDNESEVIREQIEQTKAQLSEKLESLELQISETVQSTGAAMNATVEAVQDTAQAVTGVVHDAAQSVTNAFDLRRQIDRHPWLVVGSATALGYLACELLNAPAKKGERPEAPLSSFSSASELSGDRRSVAAHTPIATTSDVAAAYESGRRSSSWHRLRDVAIGAIISVVHEVVTRSVPVMADYFIGGTIDKPILLTGNASNNRSPPLQQRLQQVEHQQLVAASEKVRSDNSF